MRHLTIPEAKDVICGELAIPGDWVVANIATNMFWPVKAQKVAFCGVDVWVMPLMKDRYPALAINRPPRRSREDCERLLMRFLSTLCWVERRGALVDGIGGGSRPNPMGREKQFGLSVCRFGSITTTSDGGAPPVSSFPCALWAFRAESWH